jgi:predicted alpha/beta-hydrolase family hydrolase
MLHIFLPGFSLKNAAEMENIADKMQEKGLNVYAHRWQHWDSDPQNTDIEDFDPQKEVTRIMQVTKLQPGSEVGLIGKSIGTYVAMHLINDHTVKPKYLIMMGVPISALSESDKALYKEVMVAIQCPTTIFQNTEDPYGTPGQVDELLGGMNYILEEIPSDDHRYNIPEKILASIS